MVYTVALLDTLFQTYGQIVWQCVKLRRHDPSAHFHAKHPADTASLEPDGFALPRVHVSFWNSNSM